MTERTLVLPAPLVRPAPNPVRPAPNPVRPAPDPVRPAPNPVRPPGAGASPRRRRLAWAVAALALLLDVAVCVPFLYDPWGWRETNLPAPGAPARTEYLLFLAGPNQAAARATFFARHPVLRVEHESTLGNTLVVSMPTTAAALARELRGQPFVRLLTRGGVVFCRAS